MKDELLKELKQAMIDKDELRKNTISMLRAAILQVEKDEQKKLNDDEIKVLVAKEIKKKKDAIIEYVKAQRQDIADDLNKEIEVLSKYLPKQLTKEEVIQIVEESINNVKAASIRDMSKVMQDLRQKTQGKADGKLVNDIVKEKLNSL